MSLANEDLIDHRLLLPGNQVYSLGGLSFLSALVPCAMRPNAASSFDEQPLEKAFSILSSIFVL